MLKKILILALFACTAPAMTHALAAETASWKTPLATSDEEFMSEMPLEDSPTKEELMDKDNDGIADGEDKEIKPQDTASTSAAKPKENVKYIYKGGSDTVLRRSIGDDRIDDGYVQGLMRQRGPR